MAISDRLLALNRSFYQTFAGPFARTRANPQPGFSLLVPFVPKRCAKVLDVGCGEGRFGRFLADIRSDLAYVGVDFSSELLQHAADALPQATFVQRDVSRPGSLDDLGSFDLVASLAVLQHIPGRSNRARMLGEMGRRLRPGGRLFLSTWQFMQSPRQLRKVVAWSTIGLSDEDVERNDYLLDWRSGGRGLRYVAFVDESELATLAREVSLSILETFRSDGREGDLNLYAILHRTDDAAPDRVSLGDNVTARAGKLT